MWLYEPARLSLKISLTYSTFKHRLIVLRTRLASSHFNSPCNWCRRGRLEHSAIERSLHSAYLPPFCRVQTLLVFRYRRRVCVCVCVAKLAIEINIAGVLIALNDERKKHVYFNWKADLTGTGDRSKIH